MKPTKSILQFATNKPLYVLITVIIITAALFPGILKLEQDNEFKGYLNETDEIPLYLNYMNDIFHSGGSNLYIAVEADNIYSYEVLNYVNTIHNAFDDFETGIDEVTSVMNIKDIKGKGNVLETYQLIDEIEDSDTGETYRDIPDTQEELNELKRKIDSNDKFKAYIVSNTTNENGIPKAWNIFISTEKMDVYDDLVIKAEKTIEDLKDDRYETYLSGEAYNLKETNQESRKDLNIQIPLVLLVICIVYFLNFKSGRGVLFPLLTNIIASLWTFSIIGYLGIKLSIIGLLLIPLLTAVGSSYTIHSLNQYYKESHTYSEKNKNKQISQAMEHILKTISIAGLTTIISFASLIPSPIVHLRTFGIFAGIGVLITVLLSLTFIPALLCLTKIPKYSKDKTFNDTLFDRVFDKIIHVVLKRNRIVFLIILGIIMVAGLGIFLVSTDSSGGDFFVEGHEVRELLDYFGDNFDGISTMDVVIDANPNHVNSVQNDIEERKRDLTGESVDPEDALVDETGDIPVDTNRGDQQSVEDPFEEDKENKDPFGDDNDQVIDDPLDEDIDEDIYTDEMFGEKEESGFDESQEETDLEELNTIEGMAIDSDFLKQVEELMEFAETLEGIGRSYSYVDIEKRFNYAWHNENPEYERIPDSDSLVEDHRSFFQGEDKNEDGLPDTLENFLDPTENKVRITLKLKNIDDRLINSGDFRRLRDDLSIYIEENFDMDKIDYFISGSSILFMDIQHSIVRSQLISIIFSLVVIALVTAFLFDSFKIGLLSLIPLGTAVIINFGIMGYTGIVLNIGTSLITAFAIGIGIDDTIHFMLNLKRYKKHHKKDDIDNVIYSTLKQTGKPIIFTSLALIFGFILVIFSSFLPIRHFSILLALTMINATIATLIFLPSIILLFPKLIKVKKSKPLGKFGRFTIK